MRTVKRIALSMGAMAAVLAATATPAAAAPAAPQHEFVATIRTGDEGAYETFRIHLVQADDILAAFASLRGESIAHPNGKVVRTGPGHNTGYTWHLDPNDVEFADFSMELCDGSPSDVSESWWEPNTDRFCPWSGRVVQMTRIVS